MKDLKRNNQSTQTEQKVGEEKIPKLFGLEIKDLTNPITVKRIRIIQAGVFFAVLIYGAYYTWENFLRAPTGIELVSEMVDAAGGMDAWNNIKSGEFTRTQNMYDKAGNQLTEQIETYYFIKTEAGLKLKVKASDKDGNEVVVSEDGDGFWATKGDLPADPKRTSKDMGRMCDSQFCNPDCASKMAFFRFSMPFKLNDNGVRPDVNNATALGLLDWNPLENFDLEGDPLVLDVSYKPTVGKDKWRFLVNPETKLIHKMEYYNKSDFGTYRPEEIYWTDHKEVDGITFSHRWTKFWSNGQVMDEYVYSEVSFNNEVEEEFFERPEGLDWSLASK